MVIGEHGQAKIVRSPDTHGRVAGVIIVATVTVTTTVFGARHFLSKNHVYIKKIFFFFLDSQSQRFPPTCSLLAAQTGGNVCSWVVRGDQA